MYARPGSRKDFTDFVLNQVQYNEMRPWLGEEGRTRKLERVNDNEQCETKSGGSESSVQNPVCPQSMRS